MKQEAKEAARQNWADESDGEEDEGKEIGSSVPATKPDHKVLEPAKEEKEEKPVVPKKDFGPPVERVRNNYGDFIVTKIEIPDLVVPQVVDEKRDSDDESEEEESEEEV
jgi:hypothetical protein